MKKKLYSNPVAEMKTMDAQPLMESSNFGIKGTKITDPNAQGFIQAAKGSSVSFDF